MSSLVIDKKDLKALKALDPVLSKYIDSVPIPTRNYADSFFISIVKTIIGQLISNKAAATIYSRLEVLLSEVSVENYLNTDKLNIIKCGIYKKKYDQIYNIAKSINNGILDFRQLVDKSDTEVIQILTSYPGVGLWSAEMIRMSGLKHPDVLAYGDLGIRNGIKKVYGLNSLSKQDFLVIKDRLSPYGTIASLYFWQAYMKE